MKKTSKSGLTKKDYLKIREVEQLYKMIHKYNLREKAYTGLLQFYIKFQKENIKLEQIKK